MKISKLFMASTLSLCLLTQSSLPVFAKTIEDLSLEEQSLKSKESQITQEINDLVESVNDTYQQLEEVKKSIQETNNKLEEYQSEIQVTEARIQERADVISSRMQSMQIHFKQQTTLQLLLTADSFSDFLQRIYAVSVLQHSEKQKIQALFEDRDHLETLQDLVLSEQTHLQQQEALLSQQTETFNQRLSDLETILSENQSLLTQISTERAQLAEQLSKEKEQTHLEKIKKEAEQAKQKEVISQDQAQENVSLEQNQAVTDTPMLTGRQLTVQATAYSREEGGYITATGINLFENPWVIAVDPSVIPLWSTVEVPGYGIAVAGDTGGAIKGNIIDLHMNTIAECEQWGRRTVTITILN